jgi:hypothetical protein
MSFVILRSRKKENIRFEKDNSKRKNSGKTNLTGYQIHLLQKISLGSSHY